MTLVKKLFENIVGKGENAGYQHFLLFPQCFLPNQLHKSSFELRLKRHLQLLSNWTGLKFCRLVKSHQLFKKYITEIYMKKRYKSSRIKNNKITKKICLMVFT